MYCDGSAVPCFDGVEGEVRGGEIDGDEPLSSSVVSSLDPSDADGWLPTMTRSESSASSSSSSSLSASSFSHPPLDFVLEPSRTKARVDRMADFQRALGSKLSRRPDKSSSFDGVCVVSH